jgi:hypothetical protein
MKLVATLALLALATAGTAHADAPATEPEKDPGTALALSAAGTGASAALVLVPLALGDGNKGWGTVMIGVGLASALITPGLGEIYAGEGVSAGTMVRIAGGALGVGGLLMAVNTTTDISSTFGSHIEGAAILFYGGAAIFGAGVIMDLVHAPTAAREANEARFTVAPTIVGAGADRHLGLGVAGTF